MKQKNHNSTITEAGRQWAVRFFHSSPDATGVTVCPITDGRPDESWQAVSFFRKPTERKSAISSCVTQLCEAMFS